MLSNCGHGESGYTNQNAGDQDGTEYRLCGWFSYPWSCVLRYTDDKVADVIADLAEKAAKNDHVGYDQTDRLTFWKQLEANGYRPDLISEDCEADCSSSTSAIVKAAGILTDNAKLANVETWLTTYIMRDKLHAAGFEVLTAAKYLTSADYLRRGDILLNDDNHVCINVTDGELAEKEYDEFAISPNISLQLEADGYWGTLTTTRLQQVLGTVVDGEVWHQYPGSCEDERQTTGWKYDKTQQGSPCIRKLQETIGTEVDGLWGPNSRRAMAEHYNAADYAGAIKALQNKLNQGEV
jgi:hypothetical protein